MRGLIVFGVIIGLLIASWNYLFAKGGLIRYLDAHPDTIGAAFMIYNMGRVHDVFGRKTKALSMYQRILDQYPDSRYGMESQFGTAKCYQDLKKFKEALAAYEELLETYPDTKYGRSVRKNIEILKSR